MVVHRLAKKKYAHDPLGGAGGLIVGGRWHHKGSRIVYCAQTLSLASLEFFVHFEVISPKSSIPPLKSVNVGKSWSGCGSLNGGEKTQSIRLG